MTQASILELEDVQFRWPGRRAFALHVSKLDIAPGETVLLLGQSGSGKSTLLSLICGTVLANRGRVVVRGTDIQALSGGQRDRFRAETIGMIFQQFNLLPFGTVADNVALPLRFAPERRARVAAPLAEARRLCEALGLPSSTLMEKASTLSVGQQQRVAVARALIGSPPLIIADEPTSALDSSSQEAFLDLLFAQVRKERAALLMVSHDPRMAERFDRVLKMDDIAQVQESAI